MGLSNNGPITPYLGSWAYHQEADRAGHHYYKCFHSKGVLDVRAATVLLAREQAAQHWRLGKRAHEIAVVLYAKHEIGKPPRPVALDPASL